MPRASHWLGFVFVLPLLFWAFSEQSSLFPHIAQLHAMPNQASQKEWIPEPETGPGALEKALQSVMPPVPPPLPQPIKSDLSLPPEAPSLNLKFSVVLPVQAQIEPPAAPLVGGVPPIMPVQDVPKIVLPSAPEETAPLIVVPDPPPSSQPGEFTMKVMPYIFSAVAAGLMASSALAADPKEDLTIAVEKLQTAIKNLEDLEKRLNDYKVANAAALTQVKDDVKSLESKVRQIEDDLKLLRSTVNNQASTSKRDTVEAPRTARIKLTNEFVEEMTVLLNGASYQMLPGQSRTITIPAGPFTYQVLNLQQTVQDRTITAGEEKPIRIYTQRN